jgi:thioredoxin reductase
VSSQWRKKAEVVMADDVYEITIIGGGPAGLFASFYAGMRAARTKLIEASERLGGIMVTEYPDEVLRDVAGFTLTSAKALAADLIRQMEIYNHDICLGEAVNGLQRDETTGNWMITTNRARHLSRTVLLGLGDYHHLVEKVPAFGEMMEKLGVKVDIQGLVVDKEMQTNLPGLFACGDIISKSDDLKRITPANAEAAIAVNGAVNYCRAGGESPRDTAGVRNAGS